jgi:hypothetical protein
MENLQSEKEKMLWKEAKKRVVFRNHLYSYLVINLFFWIMWFVGYSRTDHMGLPWPTWCSLGWGFGLFWHYISAFVMGNKYNQVEKEFEKLKSKNL